MKKNYAVIDIEESKLYRNTIEFKTAFGTVSIPRSQALVLEVRSTFKAVRNGDHTGIARVIVPNRKGLQTADGYVGRWEKGEIR